jgi:pyrimidine operon attenuation protein/uracil phosphoribosyltransferase
MKIKATLMDEKSLGRALMRISHEISEKNKGVSEIVLLGIKRRGECLANILKQNLQQIEGVSVPCGSLDISFYRDDLEKIAENPVLNPATLSIPVADKTVVLVDDVIYTGRTARAAIEAVFSLGRPKAIQLAVLIDRGHRELPIRPDYVGKNIPTSHSEIVEVRLTEYDGETGVYLLEK